jgi:methylated-DNA-[protein]-cysteine S-methyltransferase
MTDQTELKCGLTATALGWVGVVGGPKGIVRAVLPRATARTALEALQERLQASLVRDDAAFVGVLDALRRYCAGEREALDFPVDLSGATPFQRRVWEAVRAIPYGQTMSYQDVAWEVGCPQGPRAVGQAMGRNPVPMFVPCHRVVASGGGLGGFGGGLELKRRMLEMENKASK